jgi:glycosyltransferase involved in cell wall biosynthesis
LRVLLALDWFLKVAEGQARGLRSLGDEVLLLCRSHSLEYGGDDRERRAVLTTLEDAGVEVLEVPGKRYRPRHLDAIVAAGRRIRRWRPDVVSAHENYDPRLWALCRSHPLVLTLHDPVRHPGDPPAALPERLVGAAWARSADRLVVHGSELVADLPVRLHRREIRVVPHGIDVHPEPLPPPATPTVLLFGRLGRYKGLRVLLEAMRILWESRPEVRVLIAGRGPEARHVPRDERVTLIERYIAEDELDPLFARASVCVLPYLQASQSGVGLQAIARGVPVVVTRAGALPDLTADPAAIVPVGDAPALARALERALAGRVSRLDVLAFARPRFDWRAVAAQYRSVYAEVAR